MEEDLSIYGFEEKPETPHAILRAKERYGIDLTVEDLQNMSKICQENSWRREYKKDLGYNKHHLHISYKDVWFNIIYSGTTKYIVTILHPKSDPKSKIV